MTEIEKLEIHLKDIGIPYELMKAYDGFQITVFDSRMKYRFDAICHSLSYGGPRGLLEVKGWWLLRKNDVEGFLTAEDVMKMFLDRLSAKKK